MEIAQSNFRHLLLAQDDVIDSLWSQKKLKAIQKGAKKIQCFKIVTEEFVSMKKKISQTRERGKPSLVPTVEKGNAYVKGISCSVAFREATHSMPGLVQTLVDVDGNSFKNFVTAAHSRPCIFRNRIKQNFHFTV